MSRDPNSEHASFVGTPLCID